MTDARRHAVPFDPEYFARRHAAGEALDAEATFRRIYETNHWAGAESRSGQGAGGDQTSVLRQALPALWRSFGVTRVLDLPCGDWSWMADVDLAGIDYTGGDLLPELAARNTARFGGPGRRFLPLDLTTSLLPAADLLLCRDCLVHFSLADIGRALANLRRAPIRYLLTTTFPGEPANLDITTGDWRPLNLERPPFGFPPPLALLVEGCTEGDGRFRDKSLGLWRVADLPTLAS